MHDESRTAVEENDEEDVDDDNVKKNIKKLPKSNFT